MFATCAFAADLPAPVYKAPPAQIADLFTGTWIVGEAGYSEGSAKTDIAGLPKIKPAGFIGGAGLQHWSRLSSGVYLGLGSTIDYADQSDKVAFGKTSSVTGKETWLGRTTVKLGMAPSPNLLLYVDGGAAYGRTQGIISSPGFSAKASDTQAGWTIGAGADYALSSSSYTAPLAVVPGATIGFEYAYVDLGRGTYCFTCSPVGLGVHANNKDNLFLINYKYRFGS